jgi:hypothetical protein
MADGARPGAIQRRRAVRWVLACGVALSDLARAFYFSPDLAFTRGRANSGALAALAETVG